jgi:hydrophobe/amphiphile efflux-1 (HAE1) family protein
MRLSHFFIDRPVFAAVVAILITLVGLIAYPSLPVAQFPEIAPPTVTVNATYPGASAETVAELVATPIEQQINGVQDMLYMSSQSTGDGHMTITVTFKLGTNINTAQVLVQNRVATALPLLPQEIQSTGVIVRQSSPDLLLAIHLYSPDRSLDPQYIANYATLQVHDDLLRLPGVGDISTRGARDYSMRIWIDPDKAAARNLTVEDIVGALRSHNVQVAAGALNQPPFGPGGGSVQLNIQAQGLLSKPSEFGNIIVRTDAQGRYTRISDVARVDLGAQDYTTSAFLNGEPAVALIMFQQPGANALKTAEEIKAEMKRLSARFPPGLAYRIIYNPTDYIHASITEVQKTLVEALILVVIVVIVFLQTWRAAVIPILAIPVSLIGTLAVMKVAGFSVNTLTMFGLVLAIGIVVDDAIVVVENIERHLRAGVSPREAAHITMDEVGGALIAICLVLVGVFVPAAFITGITGEFFRQFALTIASATVISLIVSLTLSPAVAALILKPHRHDEHSAGGWKRSLFRAADWFNDSFDKLSRGYSGRVRQLVRIVGPMLVIYAGLLILTGWRLMDTRTGFIPQQDQGNVLALINLPAGANLTRTEAVTRQALKIALQTPGVLAAGANVGVDAATNTTAPNAAQMYVVMQSFEYRAKHHQTLASITADMQKRFAAITDADLRIINPAPVRGIGTSGGFKMIVEDRTGADYAGLERAANAVLAEGSKQPAVHNAFVTFNTKTPRLFADIDRDKAELLGVPNSAVFDTLQTFLGSTFVNNFTLFGHTYQVLAQADWPFRNDETRIPQLQTRSSSGAMSPLGAFVNLKRTTGPYRVLRYNLYPAAEVQGDTSPGHSSGQALKSMEAAAARVLPANFGFEWTELAFQQRAAGSSGYLVFVLAVVFAFLLLAALYESVTLPFAVILIVPMCILAAITGVNIRGLDNNILTQVGLVVLIGLAAKNAILIVEFARQGEIEHGLSREDAAAGAAHTRLRPILMTSFAFILGVTPLAFGTGAGSEMSHALGVAVFFGMIGVTLFGLVFTPVFYMFFRRVADRLPKPPPPPPPTPTTSSLPHEPEPEMLP